MERRVKPYGHDRQLLAAFDLDAVVGVLDSRNMVTARSQYGHSHSTEHPQLHHNDRVVTAQSQHSHSTRTAQSQHSHSTRTLSSLIISASCWPCHSCSGPYATTYDGGGLESNPNLDTATPSVRQSEWYIEQRDCRPTRNLALQ